MSFTSAGVRVWDSTEAASVHGASAAQGASLNSRIVSTFATTTARDAAFSSLTSTEKAGIICWIVNRQGHSFWDPTGNRWEWVQQKRLIFQGTQGGNIDTTGATAKILVDAPNVVMPPGNRLVQINAFGYVQSITNSPLPQNIPRFLVEGSGYSRRDQLVIPDGFGLAMNCSVNDFVTFGGNVDLRIQGLNAGGGGYLRWTQTELTLFDLGPIG